MFTDRSEHDDHGNDQPSNTTGSHEFARFMTGEAGQQIDATDTNRLPNRAALEDGTKITATRGLSPRVFPSCSPTR